MTPIPRDPETHQRVQNLSRFDALARDVADAHQLISPPAGDTQAVEQLSVGQELVARTARIAEKSRIAQRAGAQVEPVAEEREDPWADLGAGNHTFNQLGFLPVPDAIEPTQVITRGRGGKLVTRVTLAGKFRDVPVDEGSDYSDARNIEAAKEQLRRGQGTPVSRLRQRSS